MLQKTKTPNSIDVSVGARVRATRAAKGMSQEKLGERCGGITFQQIQKYEKGTNRMGCSRLIQIARALDVSPAYLLADFLPEGDGTVVVEAKLRAENDDLKDKLEEIRKLATR